MQICILLGALLLWLTACTPCEDLSQQDQAVQASFQSLRASYANGRLGQAEYVGKLEKLRTREKILFEKVRSCTFDDPRVHNYWYRGRLKFPSPIQQELEKWNSDRSP